MPERPANRSPSAAKISTGALRTMATRMLESWMSSIKQGPGCQAPRASEADEDSAASRKMLRKLTQFTRPFSYLGLPALSVPCGFGNEKMPVGLQIVGRPFAEGTVLAIGHRYQEETDWHLRIPHECLESARSGAINV